jgi:alpha-L-fucosidase
MDTPAPTQLAPIHPGPFTGTLDSLKKNRYPKWFTEGKLGIWAHWGPQAVPMEGDWYARQLYEEGSKDYQDHLARYGHPSQKGHKDLIPLWKAEKWDPERLMALYKKAGAKYFVSMGAHHDNFDLWNSTYHRWNAVKMGPHRDVVGEWQKAARKEGLRFGVSEHLGASWTWFQKSRGADKSGPLEGVPYDGNDPQYEDLYHPAALPGDNGWYTTDPRWQREWYRRVKDLVDQYKPDLLYTDGPLPFGDVGASIVANLYNTNPESVYACKQPSDGRWAQDVERGVLAGIAEYPWQTDTSIGDWYYNRNWKYRGADWVIQTLVDVISKNGNLLINVVQRPDGSLDPEAEKVLADMAAWMGVNSESIYGTKPWLVYGEGPNRAKGGAFKEDFGFTAKDVRFVQKGSGTLYATLMGKPSEGAVTLVSLGKHEGDTSAITGVSLLGSHEKLQWNQDADGLHVTLPSGPYSDIATVLKVQGKDLRGFKSIPLPMRPAMPTVIGTNGVYELKADLADSSEGGPQVETRDNLPNLGFWDNPLTEVSWNVDFAAAGVYDVTASVATENAGTALDVDLMGTKQTFQVPGTGSWGSFVSVPVGRFTIASPGKTKVIARPNNPATWHPMNLRGLTFRKVG